MHFLHRIVVSPEIMRGKPVIRGTRLTVELLLRKLAEGAAATELLRMYPVVEVADIEASLRYAAVGAAE